MAGTHGDTYEDAVKNGIEALESLIISYQSTGDSLPIPSIVSSHNACAA
jgi:antitoxin HicB